ncbi:MAG: sensor domain-containing diguanylate cyclase [Campylobacterota bacterium]
MHDFSPYFDNENNELFHEFTDKYSACVNSFDDEKFSIVMAHYKKIIDTFNSSFRTEELISSFEDLARYKISISVPYVIMTNEIYGLKNILISKIVGTSADTKILDLFTIFILINNRVAKIYLHSYIDKLISLNNVRISSLSDLVEKNMISHYESHLIWLTRLAQLIKDEQQENFVELNDTMCEFGLWLHGDAKAIIQNNSKYKAIDNLHKSLHLFAKKIFNQISKKEYHILITYLEKCELISLSIGTELALIDNILMNKRVTKDSLTGALNREALRGVFESQYELSLATNSSFVLAMCDLDFFKKINDNYGHVAGDQLLKPFVKAVQENIRASDVIVRYGGEEFVIMLPAINKEKAKEVLEKIRQCFQDTYIFFNEEKVNTTVSIGMIKIKPKNIYKKDLVDEYIMIADRELYIAKNRGRNRVEAC